MSEPIKCWRARTLLDVKDVADRLQCSPQNVYRLIRERKIPRPGRIGTRLFRWPATVINEWLEQGQPPVGGIMASD